MSNLTNELGTLSALDAAKRLIGSRLIRTIAGQRLSGRIVEVEAYDQSDPASHSYRGLTERTRVMFGPAGIAYVYFSYGMHYCFNVVAGREGHGEAVLIRALEPIEGIELMSLNRRTDKLSNLMSGPGKLCQALAIDKRFYGHDLSTLPLELSLEAAIDSSQLSLTARIGIREAAGSERLWRVCLKGSQFTSRKV